MYRVFSIFVLFSIVYAKHEIYDGHVLYEVKVNNIEQTKLINTLANEIPVDVWTYALPGRDGQVLVSKDHKQKFLDALEAADIEFKVERENIKELLELEDRLLAEASSKSFNRSRSGGLSFDTIHDYETVNAYLEELAAAYPDVVTLVLGGYSFEGREINYLKLSSTNFEDPSKPIVFIESLLHAREWVTLPATLYAIEKLVIDVQEEDLIQDIDWIILPIANPDGFEHSRQSRFWRKNRATGYMVADICVGVDLNRNFDVNWGMHSSSIVCSDTFHGSGPFSEPEAAVVHEILLEHRDRTALFLDIHSFGSMILYGYATGILPPNGLILHLVGIQMAVAIDAVKMDFNPNYIVGNAAAVLYFASGIAGDYAQSVGVPLSFTYELPGHRLGLGTLNGFLVEPELIEQFGFETWEGIKAGARFVAGSNRMKSGL